MKKDNPKRRRAKDNPYTIFFCQETGKYFLTFEDEQGKRHHFEIDKSLYDEFDSFELEDLSMLNEFDNHTEHSELTDASLNKRAFYKSESVDEIVYERLRNERLHNAISELPDIQRRRLQLYYFGELTYDTIFLRNTRDFNVLIAFETMSSILGSGGAYSEILIVPEDGADTETIKAELSAGMDTDAYRVSSVYNETSVAAAARQKSMPFYLISFFTLTISAFIIYSSYKIITSERLPVIGTFLSIGANQKTVKNILMAESLVYGVSGCCFSSNQYFFFLVCTVLFIWPQKIRQNCYCFSAFRAD